MKDDRSQFAFGLAAGRRDGKIVAAAAAQFSSRAQGDRPMCRSIRTLFNFDPPASEDEIRAAARQFVRKLSGFAHPSRANAAAFEAAIEEVADSARRLIASLTTEQPPRDREATAERARERARRRFA